MAEFKWFALSLVFAVLNVVVIGVLFFLGYPKA